MPLVCNVWATFNYDGQKFPFKNKQDPQLAVTQCLIYSYYIQL